MKFRWRSATTFGLVCLVTTSGLHAAIDESGKGNEQAQVELDAMAQSIVADAERQTAELEKMANELPAASGPISLPPPMATIPANMALPQLRETLKTRLDLALTTVVSAEAANYRCGYVDDGRFYHDALIDVAGQVLSNLSVFEEKVTAEQHRQGRRADGSWLIGKYYACDERYRLEQSAYALRDLKGLTEAADRFLANLGR